MRPDIRLLLDMLTYGRPHTGTMVDVFINRFIAPIDGASVDEFGNWHVTIDLPNGEPSRVLWSCHTDTVHYEDCRQTVHLDKASQTIGLSRRSYQTSDCLGADDTCGVWLCVQMIAAKVPGRYIFHHGEERGCIGSHALAKGYHPWLTKSFDYAIALDRKGTSDIITTQLGETCASQLFAYSLADELNRASKGLLDYAPAPGIFTDTASYLRYIPECTNLSVGYERAHSPDEWIDLSYLLVLRDALCRFDESALVCERDPSDRPIMTIHRFRGI